MTNIVDKRKGMKNADAGNRKRFIDRCKDGLRKVVEKELKDKSIKDIGKKDIKVRDTTGVLDEPSFHNDSTTGNAPVVRGNNRRYHKGDKIHSQGGSGAGSGKKASDQMKEFSYTLSKKEFLDILFEDMALPNYVKESLTSDKKFRWKRAGVGPDGPIVRLNLLKTMLTSIGRKFAAKGATEEGEEKKVPFITEEDLRFNIYTKRPIFIRHAVIFAVMDISGSMGDGEKALAKRFFLLLYLFLERQYESVDIVWIMHDTEAHEVTEEVFFSETSGGGTVVSSAYEMVNKILNERYDVTKTNVYMAQCSDGDNFEPESGLIEYLEKNIIPKVQYLAYLQVQEQREGWGFRTPNIGLLSMFHTAFNNTMKVGYGFASTLDEVFPVLKHLFRKGREE